MSDDCQICRLGDICTLLNGRAYKKKELLDSGKYPVLRVGNFFTNRSWYYSDLELDDNKYCEKGDLLYAWSASFGPRIWSGPKVIYHYHIWKVQLDESKVNKNFLCYWFEWDSEKIRSEQGTGTTMIHVTKGSMEDRELCLPPLSEQKRIVAILDEAFGAIARAKENAERNLANARELASSVVEAMLLGQIQVTAEKNDSGSELLQSILAEREILWNQAEDEKISIAPDRAKRGKYNKPTPPIEVPDMQLPENWTWASLDQLGYFIVDYRGKTPPLSESGVPVVSAANIKNGEVCLDPPRFVSEETYKKWSVRGEPKGGDLIVTTEAPVGATAIYPNGKRYLLTRRVFAVRLSKCNPLYIHTVVESSYAQRFFDRHSHGATVPRILKPNLLSLPIPLPPLNVQIELAQKIEQTKTKTRLLTKLYKQKIAALDELKQSLLQKAFTGQLTSKTKELELVP